MAVVAEFTVEADEFPFGTMFAEYPDVGLEIERIIPTNEGVVPYVWVRNVSREDAQDVLDSHPTLVSGRIIDSLDSTHLCRLVWDPSYEGFLTILGEVDVTLLSAVGSADSWTLEVRAADREKLAALQRRLRENDVPATLTAVQAFMPVDGPSGTGLTDAQREALALAHERGYFERPREVTLAELAEELGISPQAVGSRIQRGLDRHLDGAFD